MFYLMGMSHIMPVLRASNGAMEKDYGIFANAIHDRPPYFFDWETEPGVLPGPVKVASIYIAHASPYWGSLLAVEDEQSLLHFCPGFRDLLQTIPIGDDRTTLFVFMKGEEFIHISRNVDLPPHDFYLPERPDLEIKQGRQVIPLSVMQRQMAISVGPAIAAFKVIRVFCPALRVVNVLCPPPVDGEHLEIVFPESGGGRYDEDLRLKQYSLYVGLLEHSVSALGITTLFPPAWALTPKGLLAGEYTGDPVHGNAKYGSLVLAQVREFLGSLS